VIAAVGAFTIAPRVLSLRAQQSAQAALGHDAPRVAITDATRALDYDPYSVQALVLRAAGFARLHAFSPARDDLVHAVALEPRNWVTWALLGDLLTRRGDRRQARAAYKRAGALDPIDGPSLLSALAADGRAA
jgi:Flp pilus assembly protein TadD